MQNQSNSLITFDTQLKTALIIIIIIVFIPGKETIKVPRKKPENLLIMASLLKSKPLTALPVELSSIWELVIM